ncbi:hypothetical protein DKX38_025880 [Salix brachista]|uniref:S-locus receptor kinase C-terminal domain-containing protein n=1 Tax=Salix brachista TaxID=2182728 RepID=A0A5N5JQ59_9ROSI|nr:hypothetical protein DKX38_025880 [Salix brachista]
MAVGIALSIFVVCGVLLVAHYMFKRKAKLIAVIFGLNVHNLGSFAWRLWKDGKPLELIEAFPGERCNLSEVTRCINISLLCVQQHPDDRPSMSTVVWMLGGENTLPQPKEPGFSKGSDPNAPNFELSSANEITNSLLYPRSVLLLWQHLAFFMPNQDLLVTLTTSRHHADRKVNRFDNNISRRGVVPKTSTKKAKDYLVGPLLLGFFIFVVIGSSLFQKIRTTTDRGMT